MTPTPTEPEPTHPNLEGQVPDLATPAQRQAALDQAFDYRGDVTIQTTDGQTIEGYVFDRRSEGPAPFVRIIRSSDGQRVNVPYADIQGLVFSGKDTAAGKSWETWVRKYQEKRARGEDASLHAEELD